MSNVYTQEALINLLESKGIIKKAELLEEIKKTQGEPKDMKRLSFTFLPFFLISCVLPIHSDAQSPSPSWSVYFSSKGECTQAIINELDKAKSCILVQDYSFTSAPIAKALLNAHKKWILEIR